MQSFCTQTVSPHLNTEAGFDRYVCVKGFCSLLWGLVLIDGGLSAFKRQLLAGQNSTAFLISAAPHFTLK